MIDEKKEAGLNAVVEDILEVSLENFQAEVVDKSQQVPVLLEFYADQAEQCASTSDWKFSRFTSDGLAWQNVGKGSYSLSGK